MPYTLDQDESRLDDRLEHFFAYLPFEVNPAASNQLTLCPGGANAYFALMSLRRSNDQQRKPPANDGQPHNYKITLVGGENVIVVSGARVVRSIRHKRSGDLFMLDLFSFDSGPPINWFGLAEWNPRFKIPTHPAGEPFWEQTATLQSAGQPVPYAWNICNVHASGNAGGVLSESLGLVVPLLQGGFLQTIQGLCQNVTPGAASPNAMPSVTISSEGQDKSFFTAPTGALNPCPGFAAVAAGAFAPTDSRSVDYETFRNLGKLNPDRIVDRLEAWVLPNWEQRKGILQTEPQTRLPGSGIPAEIVYLDALGNAAVPTIIP
ncbi:MAG: hypothetical protein ACFCD0_16435 [Gemmataceae bacterium]